SVERRKLEAPGDPNGELGICDLVARLDGFRTMIEDSRRRGRLFRLRQRDHLGLADSEAQISAEPGSSAQVVAEVLHPDAAVVLGELRGRFLLLGSQDIEPRKAPGLKPRA